MRAITAFTAFALITNSAWADGAVQGTEIRAVSGMPDELQIELARLGEPIWRNVTADKRTLSALLVDECGVLSPNVSAVVEAEAVQLNGAALDAELPVGARAAIPFCLRLDKNVVVMIKPGDRLENILRDRYGVYGPHTLQATVEANTTAGTPPSVEDFVKSLQPGQEIVLPFTAEKRVFVARNSQTDVTTEIAKLVTPGITAAIENSLAPLEIKPETVKDKYDLVESVVPTGTGDENGCGANEDTPSPIPLKDLEALYEFESKKWEADEGEPLKSVVLGIVDTGLAQPADDFFTDQVLAKNRAEANGLPNVDDDSPNNSAIDDIYGVNFNAAVPTGFISPYASQDEHWKYHGTKMASLMLGGPRIGEWLGRRPPIKLKVVNFASSEMVDQLVSPYRLNHALTYLVNQRAKVINLSLASKQNLAEVALSNVKYASTVFVVAAGNAKLGEGVDLTFNHVYPAIFGGEMGDNRTNFITVGAHNRSGLKATFSNYSDRFVDLYAPGCGVLTRDGGGKEVADDGTSPATALVSHVAGLLATIGIDEPRLIKYRILVGLDYNDNLKGAWTRGKLNSLKALSLSRDVVQIKAAPLRYDFIDDKSQFFKGCKNTAGVPNDPDELFKVVPNVTNNGKIELHLWVMEEDRLAQYRCDQATGVNIRLRSGEALGLDVLEDVVFRWRQ